jgi:hypothetical protein
MKTIRCKKQKRGGQHPQTGKKKPKTKVVDLAFVEPAAEHLHWSHGKKVAGFFWGQFLNIIDLWSVFGPKMGAYSVTPKLTVPEFSL